MSKTVYCIITAVVFLVGCGKTNSIKHGDQFEVLEQLRVTAETQWEQPFSDGFTCMIPKGTVLEVLYSTTPVALFFECRPIKLKGQSDNNFIVEQLVPQSIRTKHGFLGFSVSLHVECIGTKLKKL